MNPDVIFPNLGIQIQNLPRVLFSIGNFDIYTYGVCIAIALLVGCFYGLHEIKRTRQNEDDYVNFMIFAIVFAIIGARLYYVAFDWGYYSQHLLEIFDLRGGGLAIYGGVLAAVLTLLIFTKIKHLSFGLFADTCAPGLIIGQAIGRWGNFFNREAFGNYTNGIFAMQYVKDQVNPGIIPQNVLDHIVINNGVEYIQVTPTFLLESIGCVMIFIFFMLYKKHKRFNGEIAAWYCVLYGTLRFFIEGLRTDQLLIWNTQIPVSQVVSLVLVVGGLIFIIFGKKFLKSKFPLPDSKVLNIEDEGLNQA